MLFKSFTSKFLFKIYLYLLNLFMELVVVIIYFLSGYIYQNFAVQH